MRKSYFKWIIQKANANSLDFNKFDQRNKTLTKSREVLSFVFSLGILMLVTVARAVEAPIEPPVASFPDISVNLATNDLFVRLIEAAAGERKSLYDDIRTKNKTALADLHDKVVLLQPHAQKKWDTAEHSVANLPWYTTLATAVAGFAGIVLENSQDKEKYITVSTALMSGLVLWLCQPNKATDPAEIMAYANQIDGAQLAFDGAFPPASQKDATFWTDSSADWTAKCEGIQTKMAEFFKKNSDIEVAAYSKCNCSTF